MYVQERERERERQVVSPSVDCEPAQEEEAALSRLRYVIDSSPHTSPHTPALEMCVFYGVEVGMPESWDRGLKNQTEVEPVFSFNIDNICERGCLISCHFNRLVSPACCC